MRNVVSMLPPASVVGDLKQSAPESSSPHGWIHVSPRSLDAQWYLDVHRSNPLVSTSARHPWRMMYSDFAWPDL